MDLVAAVASLGAEYIACKALRVNPNQHLVLGPDFTLYQGDVLHVVYIIFVNDDLKLTAVPGRNGSRSGPPDERFVLHPEIDQIGDGGDIQTMFPRKYLK